MAMKTVLKITGLLITTIIAFLVSWLLVGFTKTISIIIQAAHGLLRLTCEIAKFGKTNHNTIGIKID